MSELWTLFNTIKDEFDKEDGIKEEKHTLVSISKSNAADLKREKDARKKKKKAKGLFFSPR